MPAGNFGVTHVSGLSIGFDLARTDFTPRERGASAVFSVGTQGAGITGIYSSVVSVTPGSVPASASASTTAQITLTGAAIGDSVIVTPTSAWSGLYFPIYYKAEVTAANTVDIVFSNSSGLAIVPDAMNWRVTAIGF
jgi:hypothetical protein